MNYMTILGKISDSVGLDVDFFEKHTREQIVMFISFLDRTIKNLCYCMTVISKSNGLHFYVKYFEIRTKASVVKNFAIEIEGIKYTGNLDVRSDSGGLIGPLSSGFNKHTNKNQTKDELFETQICGIFLPRGVRTIPHFKHVSLNT